MKKSLESAKDDLKRIQLEDKANKSGVSIIDFDKYASYVRTKTFVIVLLVFLVLLFELAYFFKSGQYDRAVRNCYSYFRSLQGSQVIEICREVFK